MKKFLLAFVFTAILCAFAYAGFMLLQQDRAKKMLEEAPNLDIPTSVVALHAKAIEGTLDLVPPEEVGMSLINAGFPPERPNLDLTPRAFLVGTTLAKADRYIVAESVYRLDTATNRRFSMFMIPLKSDFDPASMSEMRMKDRRLRSANVNGYNVILWRNGNWYIVFVTDLVGKEMSDVLEFVLDAEWKYH